MSVESLLFNEDPGRMRRQRQVLAPEGVALTITLGEHAIRATAFIIDLSIVIAVIVAIALIAIFTTIGDTENALLPLLILAYGFCSLGYFCGLELAWKGQTVGKRAMGLRVVDAAGGRLTPKALITRNLSREIEVWLPITTAVQMGVAGGYASLFTAASAFLFILMPILTRDRTRIGDMIAGTVVIENARPQLLKEVSDQKVEITFTAEQVERYQLSHLEKLEAVLHLDRGPQVPHLRIALAQQIAAKIDYPFPPTTEHEALAFLTSYYTHLRARLEHRKLFDKTGEIT